MVVPLLCSCVAHAATRGKGAASPSLPAFLSVVHGRRYLSPFKEGGTMIVVRDIFQVKFGRMKEAKELWGQMMKLFPATEKDRPRLLTDLTGQYYTLVMENTHKNLAEWESSMSQMDPAMGALYQKFTQLVDNGRREMFTIVE
jgi:hypothetical protein